MKREVSEFTAAVAVTLALLGLPDAASAQTDSFTVGPNWRAIWYASCPYNSYLFEVESLNANWVSIGVGDLGNDPARVAALVDSAKARRGSSGDMLLNTSPVAGWEHPCRDSNPESPSRAGTALLHPTHDA